MELIVTESLTPEDHAAIVAGLTAYNQKQVGYDDYKPLNIVVRDDSNTVIAGLTGETYWDWLFVDLLWVAEESRARGLGQTLLQRAEDEARTRGCKNVYLDTFSFQARGFYEKLGYTVFGTLPNFPREHTRFFLTKAL